MPERIVVSTEKMPEGEYKTYRKTALTRAIRMPGPFTIESSLGPLHCDDGFVGIDARGYPYPLDAEEFALIYEEVGAEEGGADHTVSVTDLYAGLLAELRAEQQEAGRGERGRALSIAITDLEASLLRYRDAETKPPLPPQHEGSGGTVSKTR